MENVYRVNRLQNPFLFVATAFLLGLTALASAGCATFLGGSRPNAADIRFSVNSFGGPTYSQGATQTLRAYDVPQRLSKEQLELLLDKLDANPTPELVYAYVETSYFRARSIEKKRPEEAKRLYISSALYAYHYLFNPALNAEYDSVFNAKQLDVCSLYNGACERLLHLELQNADDVLFPFRDGSIHEALLDGSGYSIYTKIATCSWQKSELDSFQLVADCPVSELQFDCRRYGLGVPLVAKRRPNPNDERPEEEYYPEGLCFPASALLRPNLNLPMGTLPPIEPDAQAESDAEASAQAVLEIYDPLVGSVVRAREKELLIESDITTPLAYFLNEKSRLNDKAAVKGLFRPEELLEIIPNDSQKRERALQGLYMLEPYDPNKIPVVMTHGLGSSPTTWLEMYNALRNSSEIQRAYQFWFYFYPTGQPFWASAAQLRLELARIRETVDPEHSVDALDRIVLVGHSMGGLISRMQVQRSEDKIWNEISSAPLEELELDEETRRDIQDWFFFEPNRSVKRVITIATPFEGSDYANSFTQWLAEHMIAIPQKVTRVLTTLTNRDDGKINDDTLLKTSTSVDSLSPDCPIFAILDRCEIPSDVALNNIVGVIPSVANRTFYPKETDGVVEYSSSRREDVESERKAPAKHTEVHTHPAAIMEVKDILARHLAESRCEIAGKNEPKLLYRPRYDEETDERKRDLEEQNERDRARVERGQIDERDALDVPRVGRRAYLGGGVGEGRVYPGAVENVKDSRKRK